MKEGIQDSFRQWYMEYKRIHGKFPEFPADKVWQQPGFQFSVNDDGKEPQGDSEDGENNGDDAKSEDSPSTPKGKDKGGKAKPGSGKKGGKGGDEGEEDENKFKFDNSKHLTSLKTG
jgi:IQ and AAA domain-containing protein